MVLLLAGLEKLYEGSLKSSRLEFSYQVKDSLVKFKTAYTRTKPESISFVKKISWCTHGL